MIFFGREVSVWSRVGSIALGYCLCEKITLSSAAPNGGQHKTWIQYFRKNISPENLDTIFSKSIRTENLDTIQEKIYRISNLTIFEYNIFEKISASKIRIQYFQKISGSKILIQYKNCCIVYIRPDTGVLRYSDKYQTPTPGLMG